MLTALYYWYGQVAYEFFRGGESRAAIGVAVGILGLGMVFSFPDLKGKNAVFAVFIISMAVRLAVIPSAPSDDVNRYLWEGKLYSQGISPYTEAAEHEIYKEHRDSYWEEMNHRDKITAYPPLALHFFSFINSFSYSPVVYKIVFMLADLLLIGVILVLLHHYRRPLHWALFYALSPISILAFTAEAHFDVIMVLFLVFAVLAYSKKWFVLCGAAMGLAVATKIMVVIAAPLIVLKTGPKGIIAAAIVCSAPFLIHFDDSLQMLEGLISFGSKNNFNGAFNQFFEEVIGTTDKRASKICIILFAFSWSIGFWLSLKDKLWMGLCFCLGGLILFAPIVHFWYFTWFLPFVAIRPSLSWISFSITAPLYFLVHSTYLSTGDWELPVWARWLFWLPFIIIFIFQLPKQIRLLYHLMIDKKSPPRTLDNLSWSVVIPTIRVDQNIKDLIKDLESQSITPDEIVIVSTSENRESIPESSCFTIKEVHSEIGRGLQIKTGVEHASAEWCLVLHGDNLLAPHTFRLLNDALINNLEVLGGSLGQRFNRSAPGLLLIESMNEFRAALLRTSFGDQNQFFHRQTAINKEILTDQPLMEDVEMSDRLSQQGEILHLAHESTVSASKWKKQNFWKRFFTIVGFYFKYRLLFFSREKRSQLSKDFYTIYYPQKQAK